MLHLLRIEWMKVKNYKTFWILLGITVASIPAFNYMLYRMMDNKFPKVNGKNILGSPFGFPDVWQTVSWNASMLFVIPAILIITLTTNEFTYKTHRQNIIDGWSRGQFIRVKLVEIFLFSLLSTLVVTLTGLCFGFIDKVPEGTGIWHEGRYIFFYFVQMLSYSLIAFVLSILIKRAGLAMGLFFIYMIVEQILVAVGSGLYKLDLFKYLPEESTDRLIPFPYAKASFSPDQATGWGGHVPGFLLAAAIYAVAYCLISGRYFLKNDL
jgi:ABC-2 type transport system permease protein